MSTLEIIIIAAVAVAYVACTVLFTLLWIKTAGNKKNIQQKTIAYLMKHGVEIPKEIQFKVLTEGLKDEDIINNKKKVEETKVEIKPAIK